MREAAHAQAQEEAAMEARADARGFGDGGRADASATSPERVSRGAQSPRSQRKARGQSSSGPPGERDVPCVHDAARAGMMVAVEPITQDGDEAMLALATELSLTPSGGEARMGE